MPRVEYQERLTALRLGVESMADQVLERYNLAVQSMESGDETLANDVITGDHEINARYLELEGECIDLLALQQPVAGDLRFIAASFKIITDLERVGDLATNIAEYAQEEPGNLQADGELRTVADSAGAMVRDAITAYQTEDPDACREIARQDDELDAACESAGERILRELLAEQPTGTQQEAQLAATSVAFLTIRDLERVGDHAVNIAARALYMIDNNDELIY